MIKRIYYPSGAVKKILTYKSGVLHGKARQFYENGQLQIDMNYVKGIPQGAYTLYYEAGNPQIEAILSNGEFSGKVQRYKGDGTAIDFRLFAETEETVIPMADDIFIPWEVCFKKAISSSLGLLMTETAWSPGFTYEKDGYRRFIPIKQWRTPDQANTEIQNQEDTLLVAVNRSPWCEPILVSSGCSEEKIGFHLSALVADCVHQFRRDYHDTLDYAGLLQQGYGFSITLFSNGEEVL